MKTYLAKVQRRKVNSNMVTALHHVNLTVPAELEAATREFYGSVLGLQQVPKLSASRQVRTWYRIGSSELHLSVEDQERGPLSSRHVCFTVTDLAEAEQRFARLALRSFPMLDRYPARGVSMFAIRAEISWKSCKPTPQ